MSAHSAEHAKAHAAAEHHDAGHAAPAGHASEGHVDGSLAALLANLKTNLVNIAAIPAHVHHEQAHAAHGADHPTDHAKPHGTAHAPAAHAPAADHGHAAAHGSDAAHKDTAAHGHDAGHDGHGGHGERLGDAAPLFTAIPRAFKAWQAGNLETRDIEDLLRPLVDVANVSPALSFMVPKMAEGLKGLLSWGLGAHEHVHEIDPKFETLGKQILGFPQDKDGTYHHSYEGIVTGMKGEKDLDPLNLHFRQFHTKTEFDEALKNDKSTLRKNLASLIGVEGKLNETQLRSFITTLMHRLGGHGHAHTHHGHTVFSITPHHPLRPTLRAKHEALLKLYENAFNWLDQAALDKAFDTKVPEPDFPVDMETFGDVLLEKVTPDNRDRYLRPINEKTYKNTFKVKFAYLTAETTLKTAMKKPAEKEKVLAQLKKFLGVEEVPSMDLPALLDRIKTLRERVSGDPATVPAAPLDVKYNAFIESLALVETAFTDADVLAALFDDEKAPEKPIDYANIGQEVLKRTKTGPDLRAFERLYNEDEMLVPYGPLLTDANMLAEATANPDNLRALLGKFFAIAGTLTNDKINEQATLLRTGLMRLSVADVPNAHQFAVRVEGVRKAVIDNNILTPRLNYKAIGVDVLSRVRTAADAMTLNGVMSMMDVQIAVGSLFDRATLTEEIEVDLPGIQAKIRNLFGITGAVTRASIIQQAALLETALAPATLGRINVNRLLRGIQDARDLLLGTTTPAVDAKVLAKLYGKEAAVPEAPRVINYGKFGEEVLALPAADVKEQEKFLRAFVEDNFKADFGSLLSPNLKDNVLSTGKGRKLAKAQAIALFKLSDPFDDSDVLRQAAALRTRLGNGAVEGAKYTEFNRLLATILSNLTVSNIEAIFGDVTPMAVNNFIGTFRELEDRSQTAAAIRGYGSSAFRANLNYLVDADDLDSTIASTDPEVRKEAVDQIRLFMGQNTGPVRAGFVDTVVKEYEAKVGIVNAATLDADGQIRHAALLKDLGDIRTTLSAARLKALFEDKVAVDEAPFVINYRQFANEVFTRVNTPADQKKFLRGFSPLDFEAAFTAFYPVAEINNRAKTPAGRTKMKEQIDALFYPLGAAPNKVSRADMLQQAKLMLVKLGAGTVEQTKWQGLVDKMSDDIMQRLQYLLAEIYADEPEVITVQPQRLGNILKTEVQTKEEAISFLRGYKPSQVRDYFTVLADGKAFDTIIQGGQPSDLNKLQEKLRAFVGMDLGPITVEYLAQIKADFEGYLNNAEPATLPADLKAKYDHFVKLLEDVVTALSAGKRLEKLFNPEVGIDYDDFGATVRALPQAAAIPFLRELNTGLLATNMMKFKLETTLDTVTSPAEREELRGKLAAFFGAPADAVLTRGDLEFLARQILLQFGDPTTLQRMDRQAYATYVALNELISTIVANVTPDRLTNINKGAKAKKKVA